MGKTQNTEDIESGNILKLTRTYEFEGEQISELDFSGFEDLSTEDMIQASDMLTRAGRVAINPEMDVQYCMYIAACATKKPHEFFKQLKLRDVVRVKNKVRNLFFGSE